MHSGMDHIVLPANNIMPAFYLCLRSRSTDGATTDCCGRHIVVSKKCHFYFCNNFGKCRPILIILSLLYSQIYTADEGGIKTITSAQVCCRTTLRNLNAQLSCIIGCNLYRPEPINACMTTSYDIRRLDVMRGLQSYNYSEKVQRILYPLCSYNMTTRYQGH